MTSDEGGRDGVAGDSARVVSPRWTMEALEPRVLLNGDGIVHDLPEWVEMVERNQYDDVFEFDAREGTTYLFELKGFWDEVDSLALRDEAGVDWLHNIYRYGEDDDLKIKYHVLWRATVSARMQLEVDHDGYGDYWLRGRQTTTQSDGENVVELKPGETVVVGEEAGDVDRYFFDVGPNADFEIELLDDADGYDEYDGNATLILYGPEGAQPVENWIYVGTEELARGRYYLDVGMLKSGTYRVRMTERVEPTYPAGPLAGAGTVAGELTMASPRIRHVMEVKAGTAYRWATTEGSATTRVYDSQGEFLGPNCSYKKRSACHMFFPRSMTWVATRDETLYVDVSASISYEDEVVPYQMVTETAGGFTAADYASATSLVAGTVDGRVGAPDDVTVYRVEAGAGDHFGLSIAPEEGKQRVLWVLAPDGRVVTHWPRSQSPRETATKWVSPSAGQFYVVVGGFDAGEYRLTMTKDVDEEAGLAVPISVPGRASGTIDFPVDVDTYRFYAERGRTYLVRASTPDGYAGHITLRGADGAGLHYLEVLSTGIGTVFVPLTSGDYEADVALYSGGPGYEFVVEHAPDDQAHWPVALAVSGAAVRGAVDFENDRDVFTFDAIAGVVYHVGVEGVRDVRVTDPDGKRVGLFEDGLLVSGRSGRYTIEVTAETSGETYRVSVDADPEDVVRRGGYWGGNPTIRRLRVGQEMRTVIDEDALNQFWFLAEPGKRYVAEVWDVARGDLEGMYLSARHVAVRDGWMLWQRTFTARPERVHLIEVFGAHGAAYSLIVREISASPEDSGDGGHGGGFEVDTGADDDAAVWDSALGWLDEDDYEDEEYDEWDDVGLFDDEWDVWVDEDEEDEVWADDESGWDVIEEEDEED